MTTTHTPFPTAIFVLANRDTREVLMPVDTIPARDLISLQRDPKMQHLIIVRRRDLVHGARL